MSQDSHDSDPRAEAGAETVAETQTTASPEAVTPEETAAEEDPRARIASLEAEVSELRDRWMRSEAEIQNVRSRGKRELEDARQYAVQKFARDAVEAAENLQRALAALPAPEEGEIALIGKLREGIAGTERAFIGILERHGVTCEQPVGKAFDANLHQAMAEQPSEEHPSGTVMQAWTPTWTLHGRLLKPAMVVVSKGAPDAK